MNGQSPDFDSIKQISPYGADYWSARDLAPLLGYSKWQNFEVAIQRAMIACEQVGQIIPDHFTDASKVIIVGKGAKQTLKDYLLSRFACYSIAQNGDPRKKQIADAQAYFIISTRENELTHLLIEQEKRLHLRERVSENNKKLAEVASQAGVLSENFGIFQNAGYKGLYGGLGVAEIKEKKQVDQREELLDRMGRAELAANDFRITQTEERLQREGTSGQTEAIETHHKVGKKVRKAIEDIGGTMPENLAAEPSLKPLLDAKHRKRQRISSKKSEEDTRTDTSSQNTLWE
jgi:DNA-damage-inducible protein D